MNLKEKLILIKENGYQAPPDRFQLILEMINNIGSLDAQLRDELIYTTLSHWIPDKSLTANELEQLLPVVLDKTICFLSLVKQIQTLSSLGLSPC